MHQKRGAGSCFSWSLLLIPTLYLPLQPNAVRSTSGIAVTYIWSTGEHVPATIIRPSTIGDGFFDVKYMQNGHDLEYSLILILTLAAARILTESSSRWMIHRLAQILGRAMKCRLCGPKVAVVFGALAICLRASFASTKVWLMTQGIGSLNPFENLKPSLLQSLPQRASMCNCSR